MADSLEFLERESNYFGKNLNDVVSLVPMWDVVKWRRDKLFITSHIGGVLYITSSSELEIEHSEFEG